MESSYDLFFKHTCRVPGPVLGSSAFQVFCIERPLGEGMTRHPRWGKGFSLVTVPLLSPGARSESS